LRVTPQSIVGTTALVYFDSPLAAGDLINSSSGNWYFGRGWTTGRSGYWGVRFSAGGSDYNYGWVSVTKTGTSLTFGDASVETTINAPIAAGAVAVPEPSTCASMLAGLACGGYSLFRRRRSP
jgi:hypothetical protein